MEKNISLVGIKTSGTLTRMRDSFRDSFPVGKELGSLGGAIFGENINSPSAER